MTVFAPEPPAPAPAVLDLRAGTPGPARPTAVLEDPTGGRRRLMAWIGGGVAVLLGLWLAALLLSGLGLFPRGAVPFAAGIVPKHDAVRHAQRPAPVRAAPAAAAEAAGPATPAGTHAAAGRSPQHITPATVRRDAPAERVKLAPRRTKATVPGRSAAPRPAPVATGRSTAPGQVSGAPPTSQGHGRTTTPGQTDIAPSQGSPRSATAHSTAPGQAGTAPGATHGAQRLATPAPTPSG